VLQYQLFKSKKFVISTIVISPMRSYQSCFEMCTRIPGSDQLGGVVSQSLPEYWSQHHDINHSQYLHGDHALQQPGKIVA
jgi:hypothetical protein